jgi:outer membrane lipoprotein-sorting protein
VIRVARSVLPAVLLALAGVAHADMDAADVLQRVESTYKKPLHLNATFEQTNTNKMMGTVDKTTGTLHVAKPDKIRFNYFKKGTKDTLKLFYLFDGKAGWMVEPPATRYRKEDMTTSSLPAAVTFFLGSETLSKDFDVAFPTGKHDGIKLELTPKKGKPSAAYAKVTLTVDGKGYRVTRTAITNSSGDVSEFAFSNVEVDKPAPAKTFVIDKKQLEGFREEKR